MATQAQPNGDSAIQQVVQALNVLYQDPDPTAKEKANAWLGEFQKSVSPSSGVHGEGKRNEFSRDDQEVEGSQLFHETTRDGLLGGVRIQSDLGAIQCHGEEV